MDTRQRNGDETGDWFDGGVFLAATIGVAGFLMLIAGIKYDRELLGALGFIPLGAALLYADALIRERYFRARRRLQMRRADHREYYECDPNREQWR